MGIGDEKLMQENTRLKAEINKLRNSLSVCESTLEWKNIAINKIVYACKKAGWKTVGDKYDSMGDDIASFIITLNGEKELSDEAADAYQKEIKLLKTQLEAAKEIAECEIEEFRYEIEDLRSELQDYELSTERDDEHNRHIEKERDNVARVCAKAGWNHNPNKHETIGESIACFVNDLKAQLKAAERVIEITKEIARTLSHSGSCEPSLRNSISAYCTCALVPLEQSLEKYEKLKAGAVEYHTGERAKSLLVEGRSGLRRAATSAGENPAAPQTCYICISCYGTKYTFDVNRIICPDCNGTGKTDSCKKTLRRCPEGKSIFCHACGHPNCGTRDEREIEELEIINGNQKGELIND
jgi:regulator of replication initiation timing